MTTSPVISVTEREPSFFAKLLGWLGIVAMLFPVGFPLYIASLLVGVTWAAVALGVIWVLLMVLAIRSVRRRPLIAFLTPIIATGMWFVVVELYSRFFDVRA